MVTMGIIPNVSGILALMYTDRMTVQRYTDGTGPDGEAEQQLAPVPKLVDVPCRLSLGSKDSPVMSADANQTNVQPTLICSPKVPLQSGDFIIVQRLVNDEAGNWANIYSGNIGRPGRYGSSLQALFQDKDKS